jgi:hypothetical protein
MNKNSNVPLPERKIGIAGESVILGLVALLTLTSFLLMIGNTLPRGLLAGTVLGVSVGGLQYLIGVAGRRLRHLLPSRKA